MKHINADNLLDYAFVNEDALVYLHLLSQVIDAAYERLGADESLPLIVSGESMGGLTALNYLIYGKRRAKGCALNCPVTDLNKIFSERRDFRRASKDGCHGVIGVFNLADATDATVHTVYPRGIDPSRSYAVTFNNCGATVELSGAEMMQKGIRVTLSGSISSELIIYEVI